MTRATPRFERRIIFARCVLAYEELKGLTLRDAFRHINHHHVILAETFDTVEAFEMFLSRHREKVLEQETANGAIPSVFHDALPDLPLSCEGVMPPRTDAEALDHNLSHYDGRHRDEEAERRDYTERMLRDLVPHIAERLATDEAFRTRVATEYVRTHCL